MPKKYNILITGAGGPAGINACKLTQKYKDRLNVFAVDCDELSAGRFFADEFKIISPVSGFDSYKQELNNFINEWKIDCVFPTVAEELVVIRQALEGRDVKILLSDQKTLEICHIKTNLYEWADKNMPDSMVGWQATDDQVILEDDDLFIKPQIGRGARGCRLIKKQELNWLIENKLIDSSYIAMEVMPGKEWTVDAYVNKDGSNAFIVPRLRLSLSGGISAKGKTVKDEQVINLTNKLLDKMPCRGPVCVQWKEDNNGQPKLVEVNPRLSGGVAITAAAGADPVKCLLAELDGEKIVDQSWNEVAVIRYFEDKILK